MFTQSLVSVVFEAKEPIEQPTAVQIDDDGKLVKCDDAAKFFGIAMPGMEPDVETLRVKATTGPLVVIHKGVAKAIVKAGTYKKGTRLTIDAGSGKLKIAGANDTVVAYAAEDVVATEDDILTVIIC